MHNQSRPLIALVTFATLSAGVSATAHAQDACIDCRKSVSGIVGIGVATLPRYVGSGDYRVVPMPVVQLEYKERLFIGGSQSGIGGGLGAYLVRRPSFAWQLMLSGSEARPESRGDALAGMGRRSGTSTAETGITYRIGAVSAKAGFATGLGNDAGSYGTFGVSTERRLARRWLGGLSTSATVADSRNMAFEFGVSNEQSARRRALVEAGDARLAGISANPYSPEAGLKEVNGSAMLAYLLTPRTRAMAFARGARLSDEAALSPLVRQRNSAAAGMALAYSF